MAGIGVVALSKTIITPVTQPCAMLMPMVDLFFCNSNSWMCLFHRSIFVIFWSGSPFFLPCRVGNFPNTPGCIGRAPGADNWVFATLGVLMTKEMYWEMEGGPDGTAIIAGSGGKLRRWQTITRKNLWIRCHSVQSLPLKCLVSLTWCDQSVLSLPKGSLVIAVFAWLSEPKSETMFIVYMFYVSALQQSLGFCPMAPHQEILHCWLCLETEDGKEVPRMHSSQVLSLLFK